MKIFSLFIIFLCFSCTEENSKRSDIDIQTDGIYEPVSLFIDESRLEDNFYDFDEFVKGGDPLLFTIKVQNNSAYRITDLNLEFLNPDVLNYKFQINDEGQNKFPGGGSCGAVLQSKKSCTIKMQFTSITSGQISQSVRLRYKNLIEEASYEAKFTILSGIPASLIFEPNENNYTFGNLVGVAQIPLVERNQREYFEKVLTIVNAGELRARSLEHSLNQSCISRISNDCPVGQNLAYSYENTNCPQTLYAKESCQIKVSYSNLNQDLDPLNPVLALKEVSYNSTAKIAYTRDPLGNKNALNSNFKSTSANIEARFESSIPELVFEDRLTVGNREQKTFRIKNTGYREGWLRKVFFTKSGDSNPSFYCKKESGDHLVCYKVADDSLIDLSDLPFIVVDKENCMNATMNKDFFNDSACLFEIVFQPSITKTTGEDLEYELRLQYDTRWLGNETIVTNSALDLRIQGSYKGAAKVQVASVSFAGNANAPNRFDTDGNAGHDLGRIPLMLEAFYERKNLNITFENIGETAATDVVITDGKGVNINMDGQTQLGVVPSGRPPYYDNITAPRSSCGKIPPGGSCQISMSFAAIQRSNEDDVFDSFFDTVLSKTSLDNYKLFRVNYEDGAVFSDTNVESNVKDISKKDTFAKIYGQPVTVGLLAKAVEVYSDGDKFFTESSYKLIKMRNIGTGSIPYLRFDNQAGDACTGAPGCAFPGFSNEIGDADPYLASAGADKDCADIVNWKGDSLHEDKGDLASGESCLFAFIFKAENEDLDSAIQEDSLTGEARRLFSQHVPSASFLYLMNNGNTFIDQRFQLVYFDGDASNPNFSGSSYDEVLSTTQSYGDAITYCFNRSSAECDLKDAPLGNIRFQALPILGVTSPFPTVSALVYRPAFDRQGLLDSLGNSIPDMPTTSFTEAFFYGPDNFLTDSSATLINNESGDFLLSRMSALKSSDYKNLCPSCEYTFFIGSHPVGKSANFSLSITENAGTTTEVLNSSVSGSNSIQTNFADLISKQIGGIPVELSGSFTPSSDGTFSQVVKIQYDNKVDNTPFELWINIVGIGVADSPDLELSYDRFAVDTNPGSPPVETWDTSSRIYANDYYNSDGVGGSTAQDVMTFQMVKLETIESDSGYVKKRLRLRNRSTTLAMNNLQYFIGDSAGSTAGPNFNSAALTIDDSSTSSHCFHGVDPNNKVVSLAPSPNAGAGHCFIDFKYQPTNVESIADLVLNFVYEVSANQFNVKNLGFSLRPLDPSRLSLEGGYLQSIVNINAAGDTDPTAYEIPLGDVTITNNNTQIQFGPIEVTNNSSDIRASLLLAYEKYNNDTKGYPTPGEWQSMAGENYVIIYDKGKTIVRANESCIYGENEAFLADYEKGFLGGTSNPCRILVDLSLTVNDVANYIDQTNHLDMQDFYIQLPYYSFERVVEDQFSFFFTGTIFPDNYLVSSNEEIFNVLGMDDKSISFNFDQASPGQSSVGSIIGYRVYYSTNNSSLNNVLFEGGKFLADIYDTTGEVNVLFNTSVEPTLQRGSFYYFKILAIRDNANYNAGRFDGLTAGKYLSDGNYPILRAMVPRANHVYLHEQEAMVSKTIIEQSGGPAGPRSYSDTISLCRDYSNSYVDKGAIRNKNYSLIDSAIWNAVKDEEEFNNYPSGYDRKSLPHWIFVSANDIDSYYSAHPAFDGNQSSQCFGDIQSCYIKCTDGCSADRAIAGGFYGSPDAYDYLSYAGETLPLAHARCYIDVAP